MKKKNRIGVWFSCNFSGFLAIGKYIVTYGAGEKNCCQWCRFSYLWCNLVTESKSSCQWCTLAFGAVTVGTLLAFFRMWTAINNWNWYINWPARHDFVVDWAVKLQYKQTKTILNRTKLTQQYHEKTFFRGFRPGKTLNRPALLQKLARVMKLWI